MNSFTGLFQRFRSDFYFYFQNAFDWLLKKKLYGPFLWMGFNCLKARATLSWQFTDHLSMSEGRRIYVKSIKQVFMMGNYFDFMKCNFKMNLELKLLPLVMGSNIIPRNIYVEGDWERKNRSRYISDPIKC